MPLFFACAVLASAWVLHDARRRRFPLYAVGVWTLATLVHAPVVLPLYLIARAFKPSPIANDADTKTTALEDANATDERETGAADPKETCATGVVESREDIPEDESEPLTSRQPTTLRASLRLKRLAPSFIYAFALLSAVGVYFYRDYHSFDAHLARAAKARLLEQRADTISEYRAALRIGDDAHTRKLLAVQLAEDGQTEAALAEFRSALRGGEPDELLSYHVASALDTLGRAGEAAGEYQKFLRGGSCARPSPDARCAEAASRLAQTQGGAVAR
jgi:tetratricopeptide (TPR) repeat protein